VNDASISVLPRFPPDTRPPGCSGESAFPRGLRSPQISPQVTKWADRRTCRRTTARSAVGKRSRRLEDGEEERIRAVGDAFVNDFLTAMLFTGCRPAELRTLQWSEVGDRIVILATKAKDREERRIPIRPEVQKVLDARRKGPDGEDLALTAHVFGDDTDRQLSRENLCGRWRDVCAKANVKDLHLHDLRAEFGSRLVESGVPMHEVRDALGHSNVVMTSTYLRTRTDSLPAAYAQPGQRKLRLVQSNGWSAPLRDVIRIIQPT
jgi:integrase